MSAGQGGKKKRLLLDYPRGKETGGIGSRLEISLRVWLYRKKRGRKMGAKGAEWQQKMIIFRGAG